MRVSARKRRERGDASRKASKNPAAERPVVRRHGTRVPGGTLQDAALELLPAEERVDEIGEHEQRDEEPERVGGGHQTRSSTQRIRYANAKHAAAIPIAARSSI